jgi:hypothetical protein
MLELIFAACIYVKTTTVDCASLGRSPYATEEACDAAAATTKQLIPDNFAAANPSLKREDISINLHHVCVPVDLPLEAKQHFAEVLAASVIATSPRPSTSAKN